MKGACACVLRGVRLGIKFCPSMERALKKAHLLWSEEQKKKQLSPQEHGRRSEDRKSTIRFNGWGSQER